ncbi:unnamed protein product [Ostreobium quekettii]|uniref:uracil phosphoribosyltransferase n=1 Tax=Ostreobium quekettii TaxID=121088 RepID=A0A8S1IKQ6_9CHLO|nr:unnamed protein product [Ostreobium quekettii]|eukprot:evm.model.scf_337.10 EVM.evm.TU.scf_337.10   scf_337:74152-80153(-)
MPLTATSHFSLPQRQWAINPARRAISGWAARRDLRRQAGAQQASTGPSNQQMLVYVPPHPLVKHWLAVVRNVATPSALFRGALGELGRILTYEALRDVLPTIDGVVDTPMGEAEVTFIDPNRPVKVIPVLRAGLALQEQATSMIPTSATYHVGCVRDDTTFEPSTYLNKLPAELSPDELIVVLDPMLATGGTMMSVLENITSRGAQAKNIRVISVVAAPPALKKISEKFPGLKIYTAIIDPEVNEQGYIIPGLGDAGDRCFGTQ